MNRCRRVGSWVGERLKDLWYGPDNNHLDSGRVLAWIAIWSLIAGQAHDIYLKQPIDLGPGGLGGGLAAVVGALGVYLFKDRQQAATTPDNSKGA
jgi:hypothetical protein